jgi:hypothetical protein
MPDHDSGLYATPRHHLRLAANCGVNDFAESILGVLQRPTRLWFR